MGTQKVISEYTEDTEKGAYKNLEYMPGPKGSDINEMYETVERTRIKVATPKSREKTYTILTRERYKWNGNKGNRRQSTHMINTTHIVESTFLEGNRLNPGVISARLRGNPDTKIVKMNGILYSIRKTTEEFAMWLIKNRNRIIGFAEKIIGYVKTVSGMIYVVFRIISNKIWTCSPAKDTSGDIAKYMGYIDIEGLTEEQKHTIYDYLADRLTGLYRNKMRIKTYISRRNICADDRGIYLFDPRILRENGRGISFSNAIKGLLDAILNRSKRTLDFALVSIK